MECVYLKALFECAICSIHDFISSSLHAEITLMTPFQQNSRKGANFVTFFTIQWLKSGQLQEELNTLTRGPAPGPHWRQSPRPPLYARHTVCPPQFTWNDDSVLEYNFYFYFSKIVDYLLQHWWLYTGHLASMAIKRFQLPQKYPEGNAFMGKITITKLFNSYSAPTVH